MDKETWLRQRNLLGSYVINKPSGIKLFHKTLHDWLLDEQSAPYFIDTEPHQKELAEYLWCCVDEGILTAEYHWLEYWLLKWPSQIPDWVSSHTLNSFVILHMSPYPGDDYWGCRYILEHAIKIQESLGNARDFSSIAESHETLGRLEERMTRPDVARAHYEKSIEIRRALASELGTPDSRMELSDELGQVAYLEERQGRLDAASVRHEEILKIWRALAAELGTQDSRNKLASRLGDVAKFERDRGNLDAALARYEEIHEIARALNAEVETLDSRRSLLITLENIAGIKQALDRRMHEPKDGVVLSNVLDDRKNWRLGDVLLINEVYGISNFPVFYEAKITQLGQIDVDNSKLLIAYVKSGKCKSIGFKQVADKVTYLCHNGEYYERNIGAVRKVEAYVEAIGLEVSSLQLVQLVEIDKVTQNLDEAFKRLQAIYEELLN